MLVVREAYLTLGQMESIGIADEAVFGEDMKQQQQAGRAAKLLCDASYFPLFAENDKNNPAAFYFTDEKAIIPTGKNGLKKAIHGEWSDMISKQEAGSGKGMAKYPPASNEQAAKLCAHLNQFVKSNGDVTEPTLSFLSSVGYLFTVAGSGMKKYSILCQRPGFKGYSLPVWSYSFAGEGGLLGGMAKLYQGYGLYPQNGDIFEWLRSLPKSETVNLTAEKYKKMKKWYCEADFARLGQKYYRLSEGIFDDGRCWDVFENGQPDADKIRCLFPDGEWIDAKAPAACIVDGGQVCIDFGTKSTVAVISDQALGSFCTLKVKKGYSEGESLYPTVLKFCSLERFLEAYEARAGRPETCWETVSIDDSVHEGGKSDSASGVFRSLKQWMMDPGTGGAVLRQKDEPDKPIILNEYGSDKNSIDPIELYAYYLGLYINNNQDNKIFMEYRLSFSSTCPEQTRQKMRESFQRGLTKSLPASIIKGREMKKFSVECTCSEPAAYAVCALACMGMPGQCRERFFYGIFDFGGGTCDFNYGIWGLEEGGKLHGDRYRILMLGDGGDPYLGGENLLELLAVQVVREKRDWFKECGYKISRPRCYEGADEDFFSASFEAANNLECLVGQLRIHVWEKNDSAPVWEQAGNRNEDNGEVKIIVLGLLPEMCDGDSPGQAQPEREDGGQPGQARPDRKGGSRFPKSELELSRKLLEDVIQTRIYEGVSEFFETFYRTLEEQKQKEVPQLCVFLAGNSCRSKWVRMMFEKYISEELDYNRIKKVELCDPMGVPGFEGRIPSDLWDGEQKAGMRARISRLGDLDGKTGVAYGLALYGNQVQIEDISTKNHLLYYLGTKSFFDIKSLKGETRCRQAIGESIPFAASAVCNLYYTKKIPKNGVLSGAKALRLNGQNVPVKENMTCFVRANSQTEISIFAVPDDDSQKHAPEDELIVDLQSGQIRKATDSDREG